MQNVSFKCKQAQFTKDQLPKQQRVYDLPQLQTCNCTVGIYMSVLSLTFSSNSNTSPNDSFFCQK